MKFFFSQGACVSIYMLQNVHGRKEKCKTGCDGPTTLFHQEDFAYNKSNIIFDPEFINEPPLNPFLANSSWPMTHRNSYAQASSPYPGPEKNDVGLTSFSSRVTRNTGLGLITLCFSSPYPGGDVAVWANTGEYIIKANTDLKYLDKVQKIFETPRGKLLSGGYTLVDFDNLFYVPTITSIEVYGDKTENEINSVIELKRTFDIPAEHLSDDNEIIVGMVMTYDGFLAYATSHGLVAVVSRDFMTAYFYFLPGGADEKISNSIACDENGGIYVVSSSNMYRIQWSGSDLSLAWVANYENKCGQEDLLLLGTGSGSTPSLMGTEVDDDRFVVITDCQDVMNLVLFWRDKIPDDWEILPGKVDRRIAGQVPVRFGNPNTNSTISEQSVLVRGYSAVVVNNELRRKDKYIPTKNPLFASGVDSITPKGAEKFSWDPSARSLKSEWTNSKVSIPNGIPTMSQKSNLMYGVTHGRGSWSFVALSWTTGEIVFKTRYGNGPMLNSCYAGTEIGPFNQLYTGVCDGMVRMRAK